MAEVNSRVRTAYGVAEEGDTATDTKSADAKKAGKDKPAKDAKADKTAEKPAAKQTALDTTEKPRDTTPGTTADQPQNK